MIYQLGIVLILISTSFIFPALAAFALNLEKKYAITFLELFFLCLIPAAIIVKKFKERELKAGQLFSFIVISWFLFFFLGSLPYKFILNISMIDAFFQSVSSLTTTGMRVIDYDIPKIMLLYEAYLQWVGGLSIIIMFLTLISPYPSFTRLHLLLELRRTFETGLVIQSRGILFTYIYLTFIMIVLLYIIERDLFVSLYYSFTTLSTGGFSYDFESLSIYSKIVLGIFAIIASINFFILYKTIFKRDLSLIKDVEFRGIILLIIILFIFLYKVEGIEFTKSILQSIFIITTAGFTIIDINHMSPSALFLILLLAIIGGGYGSTAGGIKVFRIYSFFKILLWYLERITEERKISVLKISSRKVESEEALLLVIFITLYSLTLISGVVLLTLLGRDMDIAFIMTVSAQTTLGIQIVNDLSDVEKLILCFYMFAGRIEVMPLFIFLRYVLRLHRR